MTIIIDSEYKRAAFVERSTHRTTYTPYPIERRPRTGGPLRLDEAHTKDPPRTPRAREHRRDQDTPPTIDTYQPILVSGSTSSSSRLPTRRRAPGSLRNSTQSHRSAIVLSYLLDDYGQDISFSSPTSSITSDDYVLEYTRDTWIADSGAGHHITNTLGIVRNIRTDHLPSLSGINGPNHPLRVEARGTVVLDARLVDGTRNVITLTNVMYVRDSPNNVFSVREYYKATGRGTLFDGQVRVLEKDGTVVMRGPMSDAVPYMLDVSARNAESEELVEFPRRVRDPDSTRYGPICEDVAFMVMEMASTLSQRSSTTTDGVSPLWYRLLHHLGIPTRVDTARMDPYTHRSTSSLSLSPEIISSVVDPPPHRCRSPSSTQHHPSSTWGYTNKSTLFLFMFSTVLSGLSFLVLWDIRRTLNSLDVTLTRDHCPSLSSL